MVHLDQWTGETTGKTLELEPGKENNLTIPLRGNPVQ
jgi:hypothetical protein